MTELNPTFCRRLLTAYLIATEDRPSVPSLMRLTGWPRRTLQDIIKALPGMGIELHFQQDGVRNNDGYYRIEQWGPINLQWIESHHRDLEQLLGVTPAP
ncbi:helix-turn-helix domain-containing protein [Motiliproteus sp. SC1-56]|uniref:winged helix-turn-helix domain-containing protein n=1 Tax=Motiliproteus sp. SC1-56 TaxID=2799565 RepID=UPI001A8FF708|nr:winged helix-turn-helix domain-containing protein [Motiliproteus sp. SC1-56]